MKNGKPKACCRDQENCTLKPDRCDQANVIYQADVHAEPPDTTEKSRPCGFGQSLG